MHPSAILSDHEILEEKAKGTIVIEPFNQNCLSNCSYDVTLGEWYYRKVPPHQRYDKRDRKHYAVYPVPIYNPWNPDHVKQYWGEPQHASGLSDDMYGLTAGTAVIKLDPNELILAHTREFIGGRHHITTMMKARSSLGRSGISVCRCAGWGDVDYFNRWTMEIHNSLDVPVVLPVGARVAQIVFMWSGVPERPYTGKYQTTLDIPDLMASWKPESMLPKLHQDTY
jgi:dCTP deaminase